MRHAASKGVTAVATRAAWRGLDAIVGGLRGASAPRATLTARVALYLPLGRLAPGGRHRAARRGRATTGSGSAASRATWTARSAPPPRCSTSPTTTTPATAGCFVTPEDSLRAWIGARRLGRPPGRGARDRRARQRAPARHLRQRRAGARARGTAASGSSTRSTSGRDDIARFGRLGVIASMQPYHADRRRPLGREADRARADQDDLRVPRRCSTQGAASPSAPTGRSRRSIRSSASTPPSPGARSTASIPAAGCPEQKITVEEALRAYTAGNAYGVFAEDRAGQARAGLPGRPVLLDRDLTRIQPEEIEQAAVKATVVGGRVVFRRPRAQLHLAACDGPSAVSYRPPGQSRTGPLPLSIIGSGDVTVPQRARCRIVVSSRAGSDSLTARPSPIFGLTPCIQSNLRSPEAQCRFADGSARRSSCSLCSCSSMPWVSSPRGPAARQRRGRGARRRRSTRRRTTASSTSCSACVPWPTGWPRSPISCSSATSRASPSNRGTLYLLSPVDGRTVAAVFRGKGSFAFAPNTAVEQDRLRRFENAEALESPFTELMLVFADGTLEELEGAVKFGPGVVPGEVQRDRGSESQVPRGGGQPHLRART